MNSIRVASAAKWIFSSLLLTALLGGLSQATTKTFTHIDDSNTGWGSCTSCAGGAHNADSYWMAQFQTSPAKDGSSTQLYISASKSYSNALFWNKLGAQDYATHFTWDFWIYVGPNSVNAQTLEYDMFQDVGGREYMFGSQCNYASKYWDVWNGSTSHWIQTTLPCTKWSVSTWHHIVWNYHRTTTDTKMYFDSLTLDGVVHNLNMNEPSAPLPKGWSDGLGVQWQLDTAGSALTFSEWVDEVKLTIW
ncbi:MAG TPA: hypothetical protein VFB28_03565 [Terriglobales bacterium]|nr:hypothetical protein [Terriglobales bacterium]